MPYTVLLKERRAARLRCKSVSGEGAEDSNLMAIANKTKQGIHIVARSCKMSQSHNWNLEPENPCSRPAGEMARKKMLLPDAGTMQDVFRTSQNMSQHIPFIPSP